MLGDVTRSSSRETPAARRWSPWSRGCAEGRELLLPLPPLLPRSPPPRRSVAHVLELEQTPDRTADALNRSISVIFLARRARTIVRCRREAVRRSGRIFRRSSAGAWRSFFSGGLPPGLPTPSSAAAHGASVLKLSSVARGSGGSRRDGIYGERLIPSPLAELPAAEPPRSRSRRDRVRGPRCLVNNPSMLVSMVLDAGTAGIHLVEPDRARELVLGSGRSRSERVASTSQARSMISARCVPAPR
jgi:hypothetical protein